MRKKTHSKAIKELKERIERLKLENQCGVLDAVWLMTTGLR